MIKKTVILFLLIFVISGIKSYGEEKDLRPAFEKYGIPVYDQGNRGTCSVFAITGLLEFEFARATEKFVPLSVEYLNWASNKITGETIDGSYFSDAVAAIKKYGICSNELFPYYIRNYSNKVDPSATALREARKRRNVTFLWIKDWNQKTGMDDQQITLVKELLLNEHPVAIGFRWPKKDEKCWKTENGIMTIPPEEGVFDGHSVIIVGFKDDSNVSGGGYFIFKNSHGEDYGEKGYGKMPYGYMRKFANDGVVIHLQNQ